MSSADTCVVIRATSCDAKVIGSLVGGCRITVKHQITHEILAQGLQLGGSGNTETIMQQPRTRGDATFSAEGSAAYTAELTLTEPTPVEIIAEGPLAFPQALQRAVLTTWLIPSQDVAEEGFLLELHGFIVDIMTPQSVDVLHSRDTVHLQVSVRLL